MEQIKEFEKRMDAALDHIAVHLKSSPQAGEKKDHAVAELDLLKAENTALKSELDALAEPKIANDNQEIVNRLSAEKADLAQRLEASEQARKEQAFEVQQLYEDLAKLQDHLQKLMVILLVYNCIFLKLLQLQILELFHVLEHKHDLELKFDFS